MASRAVASRSFRQRLVASVRSSRSSMPGPAIQCTQEGHEERAAPGDPGSRASVATAHRTGRGSHRKLGCELGRLLLLPVLGAVLTVVGYAPLAAPAAAAEGPHLHKTSADTPADDVPAEGLTAYDTATRQLVLYGESVSLGHPSVTWFGTWVWNGSRWRVVTRSPRLADSLVYDEATRQLLLFDPFTTKTWVWSGSRWRTLPRAGGPRLGRRPHLGGVDAAAYDETTRQVVLFVGGNARGLPPIEHANQTWVWKRDRWVRMHPAHNPPADWDDQIPLSYDAATRQLLLQGLGGDEIGGGRLFGTWAWTGSDWTNLSPRHEPPMGQIGAMAYNPVRGQTWLVDAGGELGIPPLDACLHIATTLWVWNGHDWTSVSPPATLPLVQAGTLGYDAATRQMVLTGADMCPHAPTRVAVIDKASPGPGSVYVPPVSPESSGPLPKAQQLWLAREHAPELFFDSGEHWRPLNVDDYLGEGTHYLCSDVTGLCQKNPVAGPDDLAEGANRSEELDMWTDVGTGGNFEQSFVRDPDAYHSPDRECTKYFYDCNGGPESKIYAHVVERDPYLLIDYWFFYRYNTAPGYPLYDDEHQGDWEGMTVAVSAADPAGDIEFALYRQHSGPPWSYLPQSLKCGPSHLVCGAGSRHPAVFVAKGTHASYVRPCSRKAEPAYVPEGSLYSDLNYCNQTNSWKPEGVRDGKAPWGNNANPDAVRLLDDCDGSFQSTCRIEKWVDWPGNWNGLDMSGLLGAGGATVQSPAGPAKSTRRYEYNYPVYALGKRKPPGCEPHVHCGRRAHAASAGAPSPLSVQVPAECKSWLGPDVVAMACDPAELAHAIQSGRLNSSGSLQVSAPGLDAGSAPGLAQATGPSLRPGQTIQLHGTASPGMSLYVATQTGAVSRTVGFSATQLRTAGPGLITIGKAGGATLTSKGRKLAGKVLQVTNSKPLPAPKITRASRAMRQLDVRIRTRQRQLVTIAVFGPHMRLIARRQVNVDHRRHLTFRHTRGAKTVQVIALHGSRHSKISTARVQLKHRRPHRSTHPGRKRHQPAPR